MAISLERDVVPDPHSKMSLNYSQENNGYEPLIDDDDIQGIREFLEEFFTNKLNLILAQQNRPVAEQLGSDIELELIEAKALCKDFRLERENLLNQIKDQEAKIEVLDLEGAELRAELCLANGVLRRTVWPTEDTGTAR